MVVTGGRVIWQIDDPTEALWCLFLVALEFSSLESPFHCIGRAPKITAASTIVTCGILHLHCTSAAGASYSVAPVITQVLGVRISISSRVQLHTETPTAGDEDCLCPFVPLTYE
jgi:hypothetical protein